MTATIGSDELTLVDTEGEILREYDDVVVMRDTPSDRAGNIVVKTIEAGTSATIIMIFEEGYADLECYVAPEKFAFAQSRGENLKILRRREEKLHHAGH